MDEQLKNFFDFSKDFVREEAPRGHVSGDVHAFETDSHESKKPIKREIIGKDYVNKYVEKEKERMDGLLSCDEMAAKRNKTLDDIDSDDENEAFPDIRTDEEFYDKYNFNLNRDKGLPIYAKREEIINAINENPVVILKGETGCGKTTQVPQYILDEGFKSKQYCNIVVTQPRRIAAMSIANRVSQERQWQPGTVCSYQVGLHRQRSAMEDTRLLYCTTGVLLNNLITYKTLTHYTHIVLDEVHERDQDMDFLLIVIRRLLATNSRHVKIILMSATIDPRELSDYFATKSSVPPIISASPGRNYTVNKYYRDQLHAVNWEGHMEDIDSPGISHQGYRSAIKIILVIDNMERNDKVTGKTYQQALREGSVLIFLPGIGEINSMCDTLKEMLKHDPNMKLNMVRCHSLMTPDDQRDIFDPAPPGYRKIIMSTNIAESSITVPDVSYIIDFCLEKVLVTDTSTNFSSLRLAWASKTNCRQRAGRVGRLRNGRVYRMVTKSFYNRELSEYSVPEMLRKPLQNCVLRAKELKMGTPVELLALALSPPNLSDICNTVLMLKEVGAMYPTVDGDYDPMDGDITSWGRIMSKLPLDTHLSRMIILGYVFNLLEETIIIAAGLSVHGVYVDGRTSMKADTYWMHYVFADGSGSDLVGIWRMYLTYLNMCENGMVKDASKQWANRFHLSVRALSEMHLLVQELRSRCSKLSLVPITYPTRHISDDREKALMLKVVIAGAFYPNYFVQSKSTPGAERGMYSVIAGLDPCRTVYFTSFTDRTMGELYTRKIKELFLEAKIPPENIEVTFGTGSEKVFVTFKNDGCKPEGSTYIHVPGRIKTEVYKALRLRTLIAQRSILVMEPRSALKYVQNNKIGQVIEGRWIPPSKPVAVELLALPSVFDKNIVGRITKIVSCGKFYFQPESFGDCIANMSEHFNDPRQLQNHVKNAGTITKGLLLLARRQGVYQRATVIRVDTLNSRHLLFCVRFVDYGDIEKLPMEQLRLMSPELLQQYRDLPPRVFECRLALVQPSSMASTFNAWPQQADDMLHAMAKRGRVQLEIYSLVQNVAAVKIQLQEGYLNDLLVEQKFARRTDEDYMSRMDHDFRLRKQESRGYISHQERQQVHEEYLRSKQLPQDMDLAPPPPQECTKLLKLKGPFSTLESTIYCTMRSGLSKTIKVDPGSVNFVLLDSEPQDQHDKMIVAATMNEAGPNGRILNLRGTSLMPNIPGFAAIMTMIFCPCAQLKANKTHSRYVAILAGLGHHSETMQPFYEDHDMVINLDVKIDEDDVTLINEIRYYIDSTFFNLDGALYPSAGFTDRILIYNKLYSALNRLLNKNRSFIESHSSNSDFEWQKMEEQRVPDRQPYGKRSIFPTHQTILELRNETNDTIVPLIENCKELHNYRNFEGTFDPMTCRLCKQSLETVPELRMHLLTQLHLDREQQIGFRMD
ncbi:probable ATP-dependent RNA helicase spindle-E [Drosophila subobscura]|uniref:probable ATP-dependent RNA helicase spindle-E n=1 Tax=Drosophila subobscura TaxID=7241 RepID=UPI00155A3236|nr:probable ATP-dependent RNA helicase spindle-E [Drosophila subobscura]